MRVYNYTGHSGQGEYVEVKSLEEALSLKPYGMFSVPAAGPGFDDEPFTLEFDFFTFYKNSEGLVCRPSLANVHYDSDDSFGAEAVVIFAALQKHYDQPEERRRPEPVARGTKYFGDPESGSGVRWQLFRAEDLPRDDEVATSLLGLFPHYGGVGRPFCDAPVFRRVRGRVLVTVYFGWDI